MEIGKGLFLFYKEDNRDGGSVYRRFFILSMKGLVFMGKDCRIGSIDYGGF